MDTAKFWVEYVIRHKGAQQIKSVAPKLSVYVYYNLDAYTILLGVVLFILIVPIVLILSIINVLETYFTGKSKNKRKEKPNKVKKN